MKKVVLSILVALVLLGSNPVFAKGKGKGDGGTKRQTREVRSKSKTQQQREITKKDAEKTRSKVEAEKQHARVSRGQAKKEENQGGKEITKSKPQEKVAVKGKSATNIDRGREHQQQMKAFERQMLHEEAKYRKRQAQFKRIKELAAAKGNSVVLRRLKILEEKEQVRYYKKRQSVRERMQQLATGEGKQPQKTVEKSADKERKNVKGKLDSESKKVKEPVKKTEE